MTNLYTLHDNRLKKIVADTLETMPEVSEEVKKVILAQPTSFFNQSYIKINNFEKYINSENFLYQVWGAGALLRKRVLVASTNGRNVPPKIKKIVKKALLSASEKRKALFPKDEHAGDNLRLLAENVDTLIEVFEKLV